VTRAERLSLASDFATSATTWNAAALRGFCTQRGIAEDREKALWPRGVRSLARDLNEAADERMLRRWQNETPTLYDVLVWRFADNESLRPAVAALARSDLWHPADTLARTGITARRMLRLAGKSGEIRVWLLVLAYSAAVLVWLLDGSAGRRATTSACRAAAMALG